MTAAVVDSSTLISLAWAGLLGYLWVLPVELIVPDVVLTEAVTEGLASGHPDAAAIETAVRSLQRVNTEPAETLDHAVLAAALGVGALVSNDQALGRRAANLGAHWLRTADLLVLCVHAGRVTQQDGQTALRALHSAGRLSSTLLTSYLEEV